MVQRVVGSGYHCTFTENQKESLLDIKSEEKSATGRNNDYTQKIIQSLEHQNY